MTQIKGKLVDLPPISWFGEDGLSHYLAVGLEKDLAQLTNDYGIRLRADLPSANYPLEKGSEIIPTGVGADFAGFVHILKPEIEKYPPPLIRQHLTDIYCLDNMITSGGAPIGGTYSLAKNSVYVVVKLSSTLKGASFFRISTLYIKQTFHHEFSSILMHHYAFDEQAWRQAAGEGFRYKQDDDPSFLGMFLDDLIATPLSEKVLFKRGLLEHYAETGVENEFNTYAQIIFTEPQRMKTLIAIYPAIARKYAVFKTFYLGIDPDLAPVFAAIDD